MKNILSVLLISMLFVTSCTTEGNQKRKYILPSSNGKTNKVMVVVKALDWQGKIGDKLRAVFGEHQVGLPQPETLLSASQIDPVGFSSFMRHGKAILILKEGVKEAVTVEKNKHAEPQIIVNVTAKNKEGIISILDKRGKEIIQLFKDEDIKFIQSIFKKERIDETKLKTIKNLGLTLDIPKRYRLVEDTGDFLWMRQHLKSGIARGDGTNNILVYSVPLKDKLTVADNITAVRDTIGKKHIPGSKEGMYMITEKAYTPFTFDAEIDGKKAFETRGKWEVKNDFMAGPFLNYTIIDEVNNRLIIFEGFTYAPSVNKRDFLFELEAIAKTLKIK